MALETSILKATKKVLNLDEGYTPFDPDVLMFLNTAFSTLDQLGVGPLGGITVADDTAVWTDLSVPDNQLNVIKSYVYLKVRLLFDPPSTSYHLASAEKQISEYEWRLRTYVEDVEAS